ncbi:TIGR04255 family protein [bacterium]|nr:TIGR04255 family protein [bacterium]
MPFPEAVRVIYKNNPLDRVICQLRFPPILKIETEVPSEFQERIRDAFPELHEKEEATLSIPKSVQQEIPSNVLRNIMPSVNKNYEFVSEDGFWHVNLTRTFLSLTSIKYERRSQFQSKLQPLLTALMDVYKPPYFLRIGLRYVDIIKRSVLKLDGLKWSELLQPHILGLLGATDVSENIKSLEAKYVILLEDNISMARIITGLVEWGEKSEECFMIDTDLFNTEKTNVENVMDKLNYLHVRASRLIQWLITKKLHIAMEPKEL